MKLIKLTQGKFAQVDDWRFDELNKFKWYAHNQYGKWYAGRRPLLYAVAEFVENEK